VKKLVCPHCTSQVPEHANVCVGCGAEVVRGATRAERSTVGLIFAGLAIFIVVVAMRLIEIERGSLPVPPPDSEKALFYLLGLIAFVTLGYMIGKGVARIVRRSQVRFFRTYRHQ
jgi:hypothetical protein